MATRKIIATPTGTTISVALGSTAYASDAKFAFEEPKQLQVTDKDIAREHNKWTRLLGGEKISQEQVREILSDIDDD